ncbi:MAG: uracil-DNA glycosylase [Planctomycetaceae bacterium]|nr:uracil-DNA glycosylase [Planctomycetaceae bacterium]
MPPRQPRRAAVQTLESWQAAGVSHIRPKRGTEKSAPPAAESTPVAAPPLPVVAPAPPADRQAALCQLAEVVSRCTRCTELARTRKQTVFGVGNPHAKVMFIGEAPGADEDKQGEPFVGRAGQLLNRIIVACGWQREEIYICNILRCRPPENRTPLPDEAANCREYLDGQINIIQPEYIVCWGSCAAQNLLGTTESIGKMRQRWFTYANARVLCTYHPSYLLRNPDAKKPVWDDMLLLLKEMGLKPPKLAT